MRSWEPAKPTGAKENDKQTLEKELNDASLKEQREMNGGKTLDDEFYAGKSPEVRKRLEEGTKLGTLQNPYHANLEHGAILSESKKTGKTPEKSVPIDTTSIENDKEIVEELKKMEKILMKIEEEGGKGQTSINTTQSGYDAYNVRDPLLASLNSGTLDLA